MNRYPGLFGAYARALRDGLGDPKFRAVSVGLVVLLVGGTLFYSFVEGWSALDSLYFSVVTLTTVGYGDLAPKTAAGKIFTIIYLLMGISVIVMFANQLARNAYEEREKLRAAREANRRDTHAVQPGSPPSTATTAPLSELTPATDRSPEPSH
jgi:hypothetical protein